MKTFILMIIDPQIKPLLKKANMTVVIAEKHRLTGDGVTLQKSLRVQSPDYRPRLFSIGCIPCLMDYACLRSSSQPGR